VGENKLQQSSIHKAVWVKYDGNNFELKKAHDTSLWEKANAI